MGINKLFKAIQFENNDNNYIPGLLSINGQEPDTNGNININLESEINCYKIYFTPDWNLISASTGWQSVIIEHKDATVLCIVSNDSHTQEEIFQFYEADYTQMDNTKFYFVNIRQNQIKTLVIDDSAQVLNYYVRIIPQVDAQLNQPGGAADAEKVGQHILSINNQLTNLNNTMIKTVNGIRPTNGNVQIEQSLSGVVLYNEKQALTEQQQLQAQQNLNTIDKTSFDTVQQDVQKLKEQATTQLAGFIYPFAGDINNIPSGFLLCDGHAELKKDYQELYSVIGNNYGESADDATFLLPDLQTRVPIGANSEYKLGTADGETTHTITISEMPAHSHAETLLVHGYEGWENSLKLDSHPYGVIFDIHKDDVGAAQYLETLDDIPHVAQVSAHTGTLETGGNKSHNNMQPYLVINYIISTGKKINFEKDNTLLVQVDSSGKASYSVTQINNHIAKGGVVMLYDGINYFTLLSSSQDKITFWRFIEEGQAHFKYISGENLVTENTTKLLLGKQQYFTTEEQNQIKNNLNIKKDVIIIYDDHDEVWRSNTTFEDLYDLFEGNKLGKVSIRDFISASEEYIVTNITIGEDDGWLDLECAVGTFRFHYTNNIEKIAESSVIKSVNGITPDENGNVDVESDCYIVKVNRTVGEGGEDIYTTRDFNWGELRDAVIVGKNVFCRIYDVEASEEDGFTIADDFNTLYRFTDEENYVRFTRSEDTIAETIMIYADGTIEHTRNDHKPTGITKTLLWKNASQSSSFNKQTIKVDLDGYQEVEVEFICFPLSVVKTIGADYRVNAKVTTSKSALISTGGEPIYPYGFARNFAHSASIKSYVRPFRCDDNGVYFDITYLEGRFGDIINLNTFLVPRNIYGLKGATRV